MDVEAIPFLQALVESGADSFGPPDPSVSFDESHIDELFYEPVETTATEGLGKTSMYIVIFCTLITLCIFAYSFIRLVVKIKERESQDGYRRNERMPLMQELSRNVTDESGGRKVTPDK